MTLVLALLVLQVLSAEGIFHYRSREKLNLRLNNVGDTGEPLFLTPYIESGKLEQARNLSRVTLPGVSDLESYAGFFTVDKSYNSNLFSWYFPAEQNHKEVTVTIVWLQGGPGASSFYGLFDEIGPVFVNNGTFQRRPRYQYWSQYFNVLFIDNPVGTGFSFTDSPQGYLTNQSQIGENLYKALTQFYKLFPELVNTSLVISGESYGGKHATSLAYTIHKENPTARARGEPVLPLKGVTIGDGWCDPINQLGYADYLYQLGLLIWKQRENVEKIAENTRKLIRNESWKEALHSWDKLLHNIERYMHAISLYDYGITEEYNPALFPDWAFLLDSSAVRRAIHVGNQLLNIENSEIRQYLKEDFMKSVVPWISELLDSYRILFYNGQRDIMVAYPLTINFIRHLKWSGSAEYDTEGRDYTLRSNGTNLYLISFSKQAENMSEYVFRGAGHMAPADQPLNTYAEVRIWANAIIRNSHN